MKHSKSNKLPGTHIFDFEFFMQVIGGQVVINGLGHFTHAHIIFNT